MFGDEARFQGKMMVHQDGVASYYKDCTDPQIGPGQYYDSQLETARSWKKQGPKMTDDSSSKNKTGLDRSHHYRAGVLLESGLMLSGSRVSNISDPGPGHYDPVSKTDIGYTTSKEHAKGTNFGGRSKVANEGSPERAQDNSIHTSMIKDGLLIKMVGRSDSNIGPGTYDVPLSTFQVKSFNDRVNKSLQRKEKFESPKKRTPRGTRNPNSPQSFQGVPLKYESP